MLYPRPYHGHPPPAVWMESSHGAAAAPRRNKFPNFSDGDVQIVVSDHFSYQLHSTVLKNSGPVMEELLDDELVSLKAVKKGLTIRHKLILVDNPDQRSENGTPIDCIFEPVQLDGNGRAVGGNPIGSQLNEDGEVPRIIRAYDAVLRALYNEPIYLGNAQVDGLTHLLSTALAVTTVAEYLECTHIVTQAIESTLLATGQHLYRAISINPTAWLAFGNRIKSKSIFKEALIHSAGQFNMPTVQDGLDNNLLPGEVVNVLMKKADFIKETVVQVERRLVAHYPKKLERSQGLGKCKDESISRANYSNDILLWIALTVFRHYCSDQMALDNTHHAADMGWRFMAKIYMADQAYITKHEMNHGFHSLFPMTAKGMVCLEQRLTEIKKTVRQMTFALWKNSSQLNIVETKVKYFLFTTVGETDYPWVDDDEANGEDEDEADDHTVGPIEEFHDDTIEDTMDEAEAEEMPLDKFRELLNQQVAERVFNSSPLEEMEADSRRLIEHNKDARAYNHLVSLNDWPPASPDSHFSGDTEPLDEEVYKEYYNEKRRSQEGLADMRRSIKRKRESSQ